MAESTLSLKRDDLRIAAAIVLGHGIDTAAHTASMKALQDIAVRDGLREFYYPGTDGGKKPYEWSFLRKIGSVSAVNGTAVYALADDCSGAIRRFVITAGAAADAIEIVDADTIRQLRGKEAAANGTPRMASVKISSAALSDTAGQRWEVDFYPTPNASLTIEYEYARLPDAPSDSVNSYVLGGMQHSATIKAMVSAAAERIVTPDMSRWAEEAKMRLGASIEMDSRVKKETQMGRLQTEPTYGTYPWFELQVGGPVYGWNPNGWTRSERQVVSDAINRGYRIFLSPPSMPPVAEGAPQQKPHLWSFKTPTGSLAIVCGDAQYDAPADFVGIAGEIHFQARRGKRSLRQIDPSEWEAMQATSDADASLQVVYHVSQIDAYEAAYAEPTASSVRAAYDAAYTVAYDAAIAAGSTVRASDNAGYAAGIAAANTASGDSGVAGLLAASLVEQSDPDGIPQYYAVRSKVSTSHASAHAFEILLHPTPAVDATLTFRYRCVPGDLSTSAPYPIGGKEYAEVILAAAQMVAAAGSEGADRAAQAFMMRLSAAIISDKECARTEAASWSIAKPARGSYEWLQQEVGLAVGIGPNYLMWSAEQVRQVDSAIQRGLQQFYSPPAVQEGRKAHKWSFLTPNGTLQFSSPVEGTSCEVVDGVVVVSGTDTLPEWADDGEFVVDGKTYEVESRTSETECELTDKTVTINAGTEWSMRRPFYRMDDSRSIIGDMTLAGNSFTRWVRAVSDDTIRAARIDRSASGVPQRYSIRSKLVAGAETRQQLLFWPTPVGGEVVTYKYVLNPEDLAEGESLICGPEHYETALASCISIADARQGDRFRELLIASIDADRGVKGTQNLGSAVVDASARSWDYGQLSPGFSVTIDGRVV